METSAGALKMQRKLPEIFSKNRSEESGEDNWLDFVVPHFLNDLEIKTQSKAIAIVGGRGCGKTTLLRYFCHATQFSPKREKLDDNCFCHIGLYWRADTNFLNAFAGGEQTPEVWRAAFEHLLACEFSKEVVKSLRSLNCNASRQNKYGLLEKIDLTAIQDFDSSFGTTLNEFEKDLQRKRTQLAMWVNNLDTYPRPNFLPVDSFLKTLITTLKNQLNYLSTATFAIFVDEYENLRDEQQRFINGLLKHGSPPLLYNIALKKNGWHTQETIGSESIQEIADYRVIELEKHLENNFELFAAELLFLRLAENDNQLADKIPVSSKQLRSISHIDARYKDSEYRERVIGAAEKMLPRVNERMAAQLILTDQKLKARLISNVEQALKRRGLSYQASIFIDENLPEISVLMPFLISREREDIGHLLSEFKKAKSNESQKFSSGSDLINNNLFGCVNAIYLDARRNSILFSGFSVLTLIAKGNVRHLLELIHRIFKAYEQTYTDDLPVVPSEVQANAVREASESILNTVSGLGTYGPQLYALAMSLGSIFREKHRSEKQSEPETNHFTIGSGGLDSKLQKYILEAEKWSVLFVSQETKMKSIGAINNDYILNPVFSPYFQISFRKKRSLQISTNDLLFMFEGDQTQRDSLVREFRKGDLKYAQQVDLFGDA
jgi:energy-coupling factor transporter ATP-binding protein EcfA2